MDDTDLIVNDKSNLAYQVSSKMQKSLTMWQGLLRETGGELVPEKFFWYLIDFKWSNKQWRYKTTSQLPGQLSMEQYTGKFVIPQLEPADTRSILGVCIALDRNEKAEAQYLAGVVAEWDNHMTRAHLSQMVAEFSLCQVLLPKLTYPLIATNFEKSQCYEILKLALGRALLAMGINQHFPRAVAHRPQSHHGLEIPNLFMEQLVSCILTLLKFGAQKDNPTGHLL